LGFGPFLYLYARSVVEPGSVRPVRSLAHFVPLAVSVVFLSLGPPGQPSTQNANPAGALSGLSLALIPSLLGYSALVFRTLGRHRKQLPDYFSRDSLAVNLKWLNWVTGTFVLMYLLVLAGALGGWLEIDLGTTLFVTIFSFAALKQPRVFEKVPEETPVKYEKSGLRQSEAGLLVNKLKNCMETNRPWLDPELSIEQLAATLGAPRHHLTQVINERLEKNFYRFVNEYRIEEVKRKITEGEADRLSLLGVALDAGFNSKSTFNEAFKNILGVTPSEYRKSVRT
jgi:AraC-like DNA-binding protein